MSHSIDFETLMVDGYGGTATISNVSSSDPTIVTLTIETYPTRSYLTITKVASGTATVSYDVTDSKGVTSRISYTVIFQ